MRGLRNVLQIPSQGPKHPRLPPANIRAAINSSSLIDSKGEGTVSILQVFHPPAYGGLKRRDRHAVLNAVQEGHDGLGTALDINRVRPVREHLGHA